MFRWLLGAMAAAVASAGAASAQTPAEVFQRVCMKSVFDGDYEGADAALSALGLRLVGDEDSPDGFGGETAYAGSGYDLVFWSGFDESGCNLSPPAGVSLTSLENDIAPSLNRWTREQAGGRTRWTRKTPPAVQYGPTDFEVTIATGEDGRPYVSISGS